MSNTSSALLDKLYSVQCRYEVISSDNSVFRVADFEKLSALTSDALKLLKDIGLSNCQHLEERYLGFKGFGIRERSWTRDFAKLRFDLEYPNPMEVDRGAEQILCELRTMVLIFQREFSLDCAAHLVATYDAFVRDSKEKALRMLPLLAPIEHEWSSESNYLLHSMVNQLREGDVRNLAKVRDLMLVFIENDWEV